MLIVNMQGKTYKFPEDAKAQLIGVSLIIERKGELLFLAPVITVTHVFREIEEAL